MTIRRTLIVALLAAVAAWIGAYAGANAAMQKCAPTTKTVAHAAGGDIVEVTPAPLGCG